MKTCIREGVDAWWMDASEPDFLSNVSPEKRLLEMTPTALGPAAAWLECLTRLKMQKAFMKVNEQPIRTNVFLS
jgi:alpha-glucosidase (family GH31 glycosyl hydrolase)